MSLTFRIEAGVQHHIYLFIQYYKTYKPREVFTVASLTLHCGFEQCTPENGPRARGEEGLGNGRFFLLIFYFLKKNIQL